MALGSIAFVQEPVDTGSKVPVITNWNPVIGYMLYQNNISALFYFKLILEVRLTNGSGTLLAKMKQRRNGFSEDNDGATQRARAFFDLRDIVNTQLVDTVYDQNDASAPFRSIHLLAANTAAKPFSVNGDIENGKTQIAAIYVKGYQEYSEAANTSPEEDADESTNDTLYYLQASLPLLTPRSTSDSYVQSDAFNEYHQGGSGDLFLSDVKSFAGDYGLSGYINYIQDDDYHTVAFLNDTTNFASAVKYIQIKFYTSAGVTISTTHLINNSGTGGEPPDGTLTDAKRLLYFGCGAANLEAQSTDADAKPSNNSNWAYYRVRGAIDTGGTYKTAAYYFIKQDGSCKGFKVRRLAWRNTKGGYDYFNFKMKSTQTLEFERNTYSTLLGNYNAEKFNYNDSERGKTNRQTTAKLTETLNTDWIKEEQAQLLESLIGSTNVEMVQNSDTTYTQPVMITDTSFIKKTVANDKMIQYSIKIEYSNPVNTNS
tara:strand:+ start:1713 stop:3167 length:1455 start_codon:yes stop_codon:yes gene_type:complete